MDKELLSFDNQRLALYEKESTAPCANFLVVHGMCEHKERYIDFLTYLNHRSINTFIYDLRGHGQSSEKDEYGYFKGEKDTLVKDLDVVIDYIRTKNNLPIYLLGHSMGSLIVREYIKKHDQKIDGLIVMGSPSYNHMAKWGIRLTKFLMIFKGEKHRSKFIQNMAMAYDKKFNNEKFAWLSSDENVVKAYLFDERDGFIFTLNGFKTLFELVISVYDKSSYEVHNPGLPILFMAGEEDPVISSKEDFLKAVNSLSSLYHKTEYRLYEKMRHEILNEIDHIKVYEDILDYISRTIAQ